MAITTSGTVSTYAWNQRKVIDHAFRRAGLQPEQMGSEQLQVAQDLIFSLTSEWVNAGFPLWTRQFTLAGITAGSPDVQTPPGTVDLLHCYWRIIQPYRGPAFDSNGGNAAALFGGQPNSDYTVTAASPYVAVDFGSPAEVDTVGVLLGGSTPVTAALNVLTGLTSNALAVVETLPSATYTPGQWTYFDLNPSQISTYFGLQLPGAASWTLNQLQFGLANGQDIMNGPLNIDDYYNLPDKQFRSGRPNSFYDDRQRLSPVIKIWPTPDLDAFYNGTISLLTRRYIQDPGALTNAVEVPQRWAEALIWRLAHSLIWELPPDPNHNELLLQMRIKEIANNATKSEMLAWSEERVKAPIRWSPNTRCYNV